MIIIGLCGGSGSGKGSVCKIFSEFGIPCIDTDAVYREITSAPGECLTALQNEFGIEIITESGALNRKKLASIVFSGEDSKLRLERLNEITHKYILDETKRRLDNYRTMGDAAAIVDAPVLFESGFDRECDVIVLVVAERELRITRIMSRDGITRKEAEQRINSQISDDELMLRCDYMIRNDYDLSYLKQEVKTVLKKILK